VGPLAGAAVRTALAWFFARWRPLLAMSRAGVRPLLGFSAWMMGASFQSWLFLYADNMLAGYFYGAHDLGVYSLGFNLANLLPGMLITPLAAVAYPAFSALQEDPSDVGRSLVKLQRLIAAILFPACFGLAALAGRAVTLLYGDKWIGLGWTLGVLAIMPGAGGLWSLNADAYRAVGRPDIWTKLGVVTMLILFPLLFFSGRFDYKVFVVARFVGSFTLPLLNLWAAARILRIPLGEQWRSWRAPAVCALTMFAVVMAMSYYLAPSRGIWGWAELLLMAGVGASIYAGGLRLADRSLFGEMVSSLGRLGLAKWDP
jgi:O-antigen/teichoic acid export membrane protein